MRLVALFATVLLAACGQTGSLYLPDEGVETPVDIRSPASTPPAPVPEPDDDEDDAKDAPPPGS